ncbi:hypothetical protein ABEB36_013496 [Hypothenemus hampei]|uniref:Uncharacterized protein n=1 Tax=Hypothenemus hampei TaxID=57062 RepID=A0ABD1E6J2_HYPHA
MDAVLLRLLDVDIQEQSKDNTNETSGEIVRLEHFDNDYQTSDVLKKNFETYISGYLVKKCLKVHECETCRNYARSVDELDNDRIFCYFKSYHQNTSIFGGLMMPGNDFVLFISKLDNFFRTAFEEIIIKPNIVKTLLSSTTCDFKHPCDFFPYQYLLKLFFRVSLYYTLKTINENFKSRTNKQKMIIWNNL